MLRRVSDSLGSEYLLAGQPVARADFYRNLIPACDVLAPRHLSAPGPYDSARAPSSRSHRLARDPE
jgi:hypothetical protein